jgi:nitrate reductase gamma subunit
VSSLSSQFLESRVLFWGSLPFHIGILVLFYGHLIGFLIPREVMAWNASPLRLVVLEVTALAAGLLTLVGLLLLILRRLTNTRLKAVTSNADVLLYAALLFQVVTGLWVALGYRWGSSWYAQVAAPYLKSLFLLEPNVKLLAELPLMVKLHIAGAWALFAIFPFTRLMHILVAPVPYLWRQVQVVIWNNDRRKLRRVAASGGKTGAARQN